VNVKIAFYQTPYDSVIYTLGDSDETFSLGYYKFKEYLFKNFFVRDLIGVQSELDRFSTIILLDDGSHILHQFDFSDLTQNYEELKEFNREQKEKEESDPIKDLHKRVKITAEKYYKKVLRNKISWLKRSK
jgi:hypothetical protein